MPYNNLSAVWIKTHDLGSVLCLREGDTHVNLANQEAFSVSLQLFKEKVKE